MSTELFRKQAVRAHVDVDERGGLLRVAPPSGWPALVVALALALGIGIALVARVPVLAEGRGAVRFDRKPLVVRAPAAGAVTHVAVRAGDPVRAGALLARHDKAGDVVAPAAGRVAAVEAQAADWVKEGDPIARIELEGAALEGAFTVGASQRPHLREGQPVRLALDEHPAAESGYAAGHVVAVTDGDDGTTCTVVVALDRMPPGIEATFRSGMTFTGSIVVRRERLAGVLLPFLR